MSNRKSQKQMIREYLEAGNTITPMEALTKFGCNRLSARIDEIKNDLYDSDRDYLATIQTIMIPVVGINGQIKRVARYSMVKF